MDWLTYLVYSSLWRIVRWLPEGFAYQFFYMLAKLAYLKNGKRVGRLRTNYRAVRPNASYAEIEVMVKAGLRSAMRYWCDTFRISDWDSNRISSTVKTVNENYLFDPIKSGRGVIIALPHAGNWDHAGAYFCARGALVNTVAEHLKPERLFRRFLSHRAEMGMTVLDLNAGVLGQLEEMLRQGKLVALVADRDLSRSGLDVTFFAKKARMPAGPALLAYKTKADLVTAYVSYQPDGISVHFSPPISVNYVGEQIAEIARVTQQMATQFEQQIALDPTSWHMQQRIFIDEGFVQR